MRMGAATREQIDRTQEQVLVAYEDWVERSKAKSELSADISSQFAAPMVIDEREVKGCLNVQRPLRSP